MYCVTIFSQNVLASSSSKTDCKSDDSAAVSWAPVKQNQTYNNFKNIKFLSELQTIFVVILCTNLNHLYIQGYH